MAHATVLGPATHQQNQLRCTRVKASAGLEHGTRACWRSSINRKVEGHASLVLCNGGDQRHLRLRAPEGRAAELEGTMGNEAVSACTDQCLLELPRILGRAVGQDLRVGQHDNLYIRHSNAEGGASQWIRHHVAVHPGRWEHGEERRLHRLSDSFHVGTIGISQGDLLEQFTDFCLPTAGLEFWSLHRHDGRLSHLWLGHRDVTRIFETFT
mmetsp:Transcript_19670/g.36962  ORF Transcript_19670/g.36962 Transcript_19670/m.36962 type:complete len:211 (+) Transcript_19670:691-1323(+)